MEQQIVPQEYKPLGAWAYFGYQLLFLMPLVGIIFAIVFAVGGTTNINLRNFARSYFCWLLLATIVGVLTFILMMVIGIGTYSTMSLY